MLLIPFVTKKVKIISICYTKILNFICNIHLKYSIVLVSFTDVLHPKCKSATNTTFRKWSTNTPSLAIRHILNLTITYILFVITGPTDIISSLLESFRTQNAHNFKYHQKRTKIKIHRLSTIFDSSYFCLNKWHL